MERTALTLLPVAWMLCACGSGAATCPRPAAADPALMTIEEHTENGVCKVVPPSGVTEVDVNSTLVLRMNDEAIRKRTARAGQSDPDAVATSIRRLELLREITEERARETEYLRVLVAELDTLDQPALSARVMAFGKLRRSFREAVERYARLMGRETSDFLRPRTGDALLQEHLDDALAESQEFARTLDNITWRVEAQLSKGPGRVQLHVDNYDQLESQAERRIDKLAMPVSPVSKGVAEQLQAASRLAAQVNELADDKIGLGKAIEEQLAARFNELLGQRSNVLRDAVEELAAWAEWAANADELPAPVKTEVKRVQRAVQRVRDVLDACRQLRKLESSDLAPDSLLSRTGELYQCIDAVDAMLENAPEELQQGIARLGSQAVAKLPAAAENLKNEVKSAVAGSDAWKRVASFLGSQRGTVEKTVWKSAKLIERSVDELVDGRIELLRSEREVDDLIHVRASFVKQGKLAEVGAAHSLRVVSGGLRVDVGPALVFLQPFERDDQGDSFRATPAITATLHYRSWRGSAEATGNQLWNFLDPGIGVHLAYPDMGVTERDATGNLVSTDPTAEVGIGGTLHMFGDLVQIGVGYDLQVEASYWFVGLGLQRLTDFGLSLPSGG